MKRALFVLLSWLGVNAACRWINRGKIKILVYHNVIPDGGLFENSITPSEFDAHLRHLKRHYSIVLLNQDGQWRGLNPRRINVLITFDDGFINNYVHAVPILLKHRIAACFFLVATCVENSRTPRFMDSYALRSLGPESYRTIGTTAALDMLAQGMVIGSHSLEHRDFTTMSTNDALHDAELSQTKLSDLLMTPIRLLALPWGRATGAQHQALRKFFSRVLTTQHGFNRPDDWLLKRNEVADRYHLRVAASGALDAATAIRDGLRWKPKIAKGSHSGVSTELYGR